MFNNEKKKRIWPYLLIIFTLVFAALVAAAYFWVNNLNLESLIKSDFIKNAVEDRLGEDTSELFDLLPTFLGYTKPYTYLVLFENNTELRPGGGFIGSYAVVKVEKGNIELVVLEGTEVLDGRTPENWNPVPPAPITKHLAVNKWYFRDSNWSPDYEVNSKRAMEFYKGEGGASADEIDAVVAITPTVLEEILGLVGSVEIQGIEFTKDNVIEKLEYEVEYGFNQKNIEFADRKQILKPFMLALVARMKDTVFTNFDEYFSTFKSLADERHIRVFSNDKTIESIINKNNWSGTIKQTDGDFLMWVDANLAALKTDHAMVRTLYYSIRPREDGRYVAVAEMKYSHQGSFDWRTSRYRTYARIFVPQGAELLSTQGSMKGDRTTEPGEIDEGQELGKKWFGTFISIEPGEEKTLKFEYLLPENIREQIEGGLYTLYIQKQSGTIAHNLVLDLSFEKSINTAIPEDQSLQDRDNNYKIQSNLSLDKSFEIKF